MNNSSTFNTTAVTLTTFTTTFRLKYSSCIIYIVSITWMIKSSPFITANIAELIFTSACHVVTTLRPLNYYSTVSTLPKMQIILKKLYLMFITLTLMFLKKTF
jgi:hypothetical protein